MTATLRSLSRTRRDKPLDDRLKCINTLGLRRNARGQLLG
jgi:hypothetical protein